MAASDYLSTDVPQRTFGGAPGREPKNAYRMYGSPVRLPESAAMAGNIWSACIHPSCAYPPPSSLRPPSAGSDVLRFSALVRAPCSLASIGLLHLPEVHRESAERSYPPRIYPRLSFLPAVIPADIPSHSYVTVSLSGPELPFAAPARLLEGFLLFAAAFDFTTTHEDDLALPMSKCTKLPGCSAIRLTALAVYDDFRFSFDCAPSFQPRRTHGHGHNCRPDGEFFFSVSNTSCVSPGTKYPVAWRRETHGPCPSGREKTLTCPDLAPVPLSLCFHR
ncbi:hypothetical protein LXA43DRAFT_1046077 [Ganoderma leucocontextum]|nr:hypothetical protein LXA43DRAFT_1046077 [Ganoderma leucocontextum]